MAKNDNNKDVVELWGHDFKKVKYGLDEEQVVSFIDELISQRDALTQRQEHILSLTKLAERTVAEADDMAKQAKGEALSQAEAEANAVMANAEEQAQQLIAEKKAEAVTIAQKEAETIKADAQHQVELLLREKIETIQSELGDTAQGLYRELLSQLESLKQRVRASEVDFKRTLSQTVKQTDSTTMKEEVNITRGTDVKVSLEVTPSIPAEAPEQIQAKAQSGTDKSEKEALVSVGDRETDTYGRDVDLEILPPVDISKIMKIMMYLDGLAEVKTTELIPLTDKPLVVVTLGEPVRLIEKLMALPEVSQAKEVTDGGGTTITGAADGGGKRRKIQITLSGASVSDEAEEGLSGGVSHTLSS